MVVARRTLTGLGGGVADPREVGGNMGLHEAALTRGIIGAAIEVHRHLGPGLLESTYKACLLHELRLQGLSVVSEVKVDVDYKGLVVPGGYRMAMVVDDRVVVELKAVERLMQVHEPQLLTYLRWSRCRVGLLINFHVRHLKDGLIRRVL